MKRQLQVTVDTVLHDGYHYTTLDLVGPDSSCYEDGRSGSLKSWRQLPSGWDIPRKEGRIVEDVIAKYQWSCDSILLWHHNPAFSHSLCAYGTMKHARPGSLIYTCALECARNGSCRVDRAEKSRILIRKKVEECLTHGDGLGDRLWKQRKYADFIVKCGEEIPCHRAVLAGSSPVLAAALESAMRESQDRELEVKDVEPSAMKAMLQFIYTGTVNADVAVLASVLILADRYDVKGLGEVAANQIIEKVDANSVLLISQRLKTLKNSLAVKPVWDALRERIKSDNQLMDALMG